MIFLNFDKEVINSDIAENVIEYMTGEKGTELLKAEIESRAILNMNLLTTVQHFIKTHSQKTRGGEEEDVEEDTEVQAKDDHYKKLVDYRQKAKEAWLRAIN